MKTALFLLIVIAVPQLLAFTILRKARRWPRALSLAGAFVSTLALAIGAARMDHGRPFADAASPEWGMVVAGVALVLATLNVAIALLVPRKSS